MYIKSIEIKNFKCFSDKKFLEFSSPINNNGGLNIFIGENNTGKSTIFEAFDFLRNGLPRGKKIDDLKNKSLRDDDLYVEIVFEGDVENVIENFAQKNKIDTIKKFIYEESDVKKIKIRRESSDPKKILLWNSEKNEYKNESGIEAPIQKLFELDFIWADTNPDDVTKFGSTTICGKLLGEILQAFSSNQSYVEFVKAHHKVFNDEESGLKSKLIGISSKVEEICNSQFGQATIGFHFDELDISSFLKNTRIKVDDGVETYLEEKGSGMQRAIALALLQIYAENLSKNPDGSETVKPFYIFIDEPEICLHPLAQLKLVEAFKSIGKTKQVFFTTHSPLIFKNCVSEDSGMYIFDRQFNINRLQRSGLGVIPWGPTWGEINYYA